MYNQTCKQKVVFPIRTTPPNEHYAARRVPKFAQDQIIKEKEAKRKTATN